MLDEVESLAGSRQRQTNETEPHDAIRVSIQTYSV
jgi:hypothetical protein